MQHQRIPKDAPDVFVGNHSSPLGDVPRVGIGSQRIDDSDYLFIKEEMDVFIRREQKIAAFFHSRLGSQGLSAAKSAMFCSRGCG